MEIAIQEIMNTNTETMLKLEAGTAYAERCARAKAAGYRIMLRFVRLHTGDALLSGLMAGDDLPFVTEAAAREWVRKIDAAHARGKLSYKILSFCVEAL